MNNFQQYYERMKARMAFESYYDKMKGSLILEGKSIKKDNDYPDMSSFLNDVGDTKTYKNSGEAMVAYYAKVEEFMSKKEVLMEPTTEPDLPEGKSEDDMKAAVKKGENNAYKWEKLKDTIDTDVQSQIPQADRDNPEKLKNWINDHINDPEKKKAINNVVQNVINDTIKDEIGNDVKTGWLYSVDPETGDVKAPNVTPTKKKELPYDEKEFTKLKASISKVKKQAEAWSEDLGNDSKMVELLKGDQTLQRENYKNTHKADLIQKWRKEHKDEAETSEAEILEKDDFKEMVEKEFNETSLGKAIIQNISNQEAIDAGHAVKLRWQEKYRNVLKGDESEEEKAKILDEYDRAMKNEIAAAEHDAAVNAPGKVDWSKVDPEIKKLNKRKDEIEQKKKT